MQIIKLNATDSTNEYLKNLAANASLGDYTVVMAEEQLKGRGQMGTEWISEAGKNLTFSVLKRLDGFAVSDRFLLNICVSLAVLRVLQNMKVPDLSVKWPNDILSGRSKICGILIENIVAGAKIRASIMGIGLNVNQTGFDHLPDASSLKLILKKEWDRDELLNSILNRINENFIRLEECDGKKELVASYDSHLFRMNKPSTFTSENGGNFMGFIRGVTKNGLLLVELEGSVFKEFQLKEVQLLY